MSKATNDVMDALHGEVARELKKRIASGEATAADISNAIKFLKDNNIEADPETNPGLASLARDFPEFEDEDHPHGPN